MNIYVGLAIVESMALIAVIFLLWTIYKVLDSIDTAIKAQEILSKVPTESTSIKRLIKVIENSSKSVKDAIENTRQSLKDSISQTTFRDK